MGHYTTVSHTLTWYGESKISFFHLNLLEIVVDEKYTQFPPNTKKIPSDPKSRLLPSNHFNIGDHLNHICYVRHYHSGHIIDVSARTGGIGGGGQPKEDRSGQGQGGSKIPKKVRTSFMDDPQHDMHEMIYLVAS